MTLERNMKSFFLIRLPSEARKKKYDYFFRKSLVRRSYVQMIMTEVLID